MVTEALPDSERQLLVVLITREWVRIRDDDEMQSAAAELESILRKVSGTDTRVICERAYPSRPQAAN